MTAGTAWLNGAFTKVTKAGQIAGTKTREKFHMAVSNLTAKVSSVHWNLFFFATFFSLYYYCGS